jgi:hypothetical protein
LDSTPDANNRVVAGAVIDADGGDTLRITRLSATMRRDSSV